MAELLDRNSAPSSHTALAKSPLEEIHPVNSGSTKIKDMETESLRSIEWSTYRPSLADKLRVGYFSMDRACQTEESEVIDLKETTSLLISLVQEVSLLKKTLNYTKLALQADYDSKIETRSVELYNRTNDRIAEIEELHKDRVKVVRHSFRTQLADAICKISTDYHKYYAIKDEIQAKQHQQEMNKMSKIQEEQKQNQLAQQEMLDLMQMQMSHHEMEEEDSESSKTPSISSEVERHAEEIRNLTDTISNLEDRIDEFSELLEQRNEEKEQLEIDYKMLKVNLEEEREKTVQLKKEITELKLEIEMEKKNGRMQLEKQKQELQIAMQQRMEEIKIQAKEEAEKKILNVENAAKRKEKAMEDHVRMQEALLAENSNKLQKSCSNEDLVQDLARLRDIDKMQRQEIQKLQKELEKSNKTWEVKVAILQQTMHALRDEMFLRTSFKRQSAKLQHAAITYATDAPAAVSAAVGPAKPPSASRKYQLPNIIQAPIQVLSGIEDNELERNADFDLRKPKRASAPLLRDEPNAPSPTPRNLSQIQT